MRSAAVKNFIIVLLAFLPTRAFASAPPAEHGVLTRSIEKAIEWSQHVRTEVAKGKKIDRAHFTQEVKSLRDALDEMNQSYLELSKQPAAEIAEGHFVAIKTHQTKAENERELIENEMAKQLPNYSAMKKAAKTLETALQDALREHEAELSELDVK